MPSKLVEVADIGTVLVVRRRGTRSLKLRIKPDGQIAVTVPSWLPFQAGIQFAQSRKDWIKKHRPISQSINDRQLIGKSFRMRFIPGDVAKVTTRLTKNEITVKYPVSAPIEDSSVQSAAVTAGIKALKRDAENLLPQRVKILAAKHGFNYRNIKVRNMQSRWGSCSVQKDLTFNIFLIQLPWPLIDYVILHELTHTIFLNHSPEFWAHIKSILPETNLLRKTLRNQQPYINAFDASQL